MLDILANLDKLEKTFFIPLNAHPLKKMREDPLS
jgi:hypothetical protein